MAFGNGLSSKTHDFRSVPLGLGDCSRVKKEGLSQLYAAAIAAQREFARLAFCPEPLVSLSSRSDLNRKLSRAQASYTGLNKAYVERCRFNVVEAVVEQNKRYIKQLLGRLRNCANTIPEADRKSDEQGLVRRYFYVPPALQDSVTKEELLSLQGMAEDTSKALKLLQQAIAGARSSLTPSQVAVLLEVHRQVHAKHRPIAFDREDAFVSLPLDYRLLPKEWKDLHGALQTKVAGVLQDPLNKKHRFFLEVAHPEPHKPRIRLPLALNAELLPGTPDTGLVARGLTMVLGPHSVEMRLVVAQPKKVPPPIDKVDYLLSRDFGQRNTITLSLLKLEQALDVEQVKQLQAMGQEAAKKWLTENTFSDQLKVSCRWRHSGQAFLKRIQEHATRIDALRSRIDLAYPELEQEKRALSAELGLTASAEGLPQIDVTMAPRGHASFERVQAFFRKLSHLKNLKRARRDVYRRIDALKKNWFGYLANLEAQVARESRAAVVVENLTYTAVEKESPAYKGRTFNRVMNHASRGRYARQAQAKHDWNGVPVIALPSWYTSTTCFRHGLVNASFRKTDQFRCSACQALGIPGEHADEHAADTLAVYMLLTRKSSDNHRSTVL